MSHPIHDAAFVVGFIVVCALWVIPAVLTARLAERKGRNFALFLIAGLVIGWPIPLVVALVMPTRDGRTA
jgi:hypothetical protein